MSERSGPTTDSGRVGGFSLLELTIVLTLAGLVLGVAAVTFGGYFQRSSAKRAAQVFARDLSLARSAALRSRAPVVLRFDESSRWYEIESRASGTQLVRRRFGENADVDLSGIDLKFGGDSVMFSARGVADLSTTDGGTALGEARFAAGSFVYKVNFNSLGASKVEEG